MQIICVGDLCCDLIVPYGRMLDALARGDISKEVTDTLQVTMQCGGSVGNVARHLGQLCSRPIFLTPLKRDQLGEYLLAQMEEKGVDMHWAAPSDKSNMYCVAVLDQKGERAMFCFVPPWADFPRFKKESFDAVPSFGSELLFTSGMAILDDPEHNAAVLDFFKKRKASGAKIVFDLNIRAESYGCEGERKRALDEMTGLCDILLGSGKDEFFQATGRNEIKKAALQLLSQGAGTVVARDGGNPILVLSKDTEQMIPVKPVVPVSTLGAGDSFDAMFLNCIAAGRDLPAATASASDYAGKYISGSLSIKA